MNQTILYFQKKESSKNNNIIIPSNQMGDAFSQKIFMMDMVSDLLNAPVFAISEHKVKSTTLPVYGILMRNGVKVIASGDFYEWFVSVELPKSLPADYLPIEFFRRGVDVDVNFYCYFNKKWEYGRYDPKDPSCTKFSVSVRSDHQLYTILYLLNKAFPEMTIEDDEREERQISEAIQAIYRKNGNYELAYQKKEDGSDYMTELIPGFVILMRTCRKAHDVSNCTDGYSRISKPNVLAELICKYPEVKKEFLLEERMFNTKF